MTPATESALRDWLCKLAEPAIAKAEHPHWIAARNASPDQSPDQSADWCHACATAEVARLNAEHPEHEYLVDGGWGSECDVPPYCEKCGRVLHATLSEYAVTQELDYYEAARINLRRGKQVPFLAFRIVQMLDAMPISGDEKRCRAFVRRINLARLRAAAGGKA